MHTQPHVEMPHPAALHHAPLLPAENKTIGVMKPGNTFTIEPMISEGTWKDVTWPDSWTASTMVREQCLVHVHTPDVHAVWSVVGGAASHGHTHSTCHPIVQGLELSIIYHDVVEVHQLCWLCSLLHTLLSTPHPMCVST